MRHSIRLEGYGLRLRPVVTTDAEFIIMLRGHPQVQGKIGDTVPDVPSQRRWIETYFEREGDYYFIIETAAGTAIGTIGIYDVKGCIGQWGQWVIVPEMQMAALPTAMLVHQIAFDVLELVALVGSVVASHKRVLSFHRRFGAEFTHTEPKSRCIQGEWVDMVWIRVQRSNWPAMYAHLKSLAEVAGRSLTTTVQQILPAG